MSLATPFFSVAISAYNGEKYLAQTLDSVLAQTFKDVEVVVCDNASTDSTPKLLREYNDHLRTVRLDVNRGPAGGRNAALAEVRGRYVAFLDADDLWSPDKLERCFQVIREHGAEFVFSNWMTIDARERVGAASVQPRKGQNLIQPKDPLLLLINFVPCSSVVIKRTLISGRPFNEDVTLQTLEDHLLWMRINQHTPFYYLPSPLLKYRIHDSNAGVTHRDLPRLQRYLDVVEREGWYPSEVMELARRVTRLRTLVTGRRRVQFVRDLIRLMWTTHGTERTLLNELLFFYVRHLRAGAMRKWALWPLTGRSRNHFRRG